ARVELELRGRQPAFDATRGIDAQRRRVFEERSRGGETSSRLRTSRGMLELGCDVFVGAGRRPRTMPRAPIRIGLAVGRLRQRAVDSMAILGRRRSVGR